MQDSCRFGGVLDKERLSLFLRYFLFLGASIVLYLYLDSFKLVVDYIGLFYLFIASTGIALIIVAYLMIAIYESYIFLRVCLVIGEVFKLLKGLVIFHSESVIPVFSIAMLVFACHCFISLASFCTNKGGVLAFIFTFFVISYLLAAMVLAASLLKLKKESSH